MVRSGITIGGASAFWRRRRSHRAQLYPARSMYSGKKGIGASPRRPIFIQASKSQSGCGIMLKIRRKLHSKSPSRLPEPRLPPAAAEMPIDDFLDMQLPLATNMHDANLNCQVVLAQNPHKILSTLICQLLLHYLHRNSRMRLLSMTDAYAFTHALTPLWTHRRIIKVQGPVPLRRCVYL